MKYLFDYGGTLDTGGEHWADVLWHAYERHGVPVSRETFHEAYVHTERLLGREPIISADDDFRETLSKKLHLQLQRLGQETYHTALLEDVYGMTLSHVENSRRVLEALKADGDRMVLVSNFYGNLPTVLTEMGLDHLFEHVVESARVGIRKPDTKIWQMGIDWFGCPAGEITVVGDSMKNDILPAIQLGCRTIHVDKPLTTTLLKG